MRVLPSWRYAVHTRMVSSSSSTSSLVTHRPVTPFSWFERRMITASNQPQRRLRPVVEPNSLPRVPLSRKRAGADAGGVGLGDTEYVVQPPGANTAAGRGRTGAGIG